MVILSLLGPYVDFRKNYCEKGIKTAKDKNTLSIDTILEKLNDSSNKVEDIISELSAAIDSIEEADLGIKRINTIRDILFSETKESK